MRSCCWLLVALSLCAASARGVEYVVCWCVDGDVAVEAECVPASCCTDVEEESAVVGVPADAPGAPLVGDCWDLRIEASSETSILTHKRVSGMPAFVYAYVASPLPFVPEFSSVIAAGAALATGDSRIQTLRSTILQV